MTSRYYNKNRKKGSSTGFRTLSKKVHRSARTTIKRNFNSLSRLRNIDSLLSREKSVRTTTLRDKARWEALFRTPSVLQNMLIRHPPTIGNLPVRLFVLSCHGCIDRTKIMTVPRRIAAFDLAEGDYRGHETSCILDPPLFNVMIGSNGANIGRFINAMMGGKHEDDPLHIIPQIGYRAPGDRMFNFDLEIREDDKDNFSATHGCWDITDTIASFDPKAFSFKSSVTGQYIDPNKRREITREDQPPHKEVLPVRELLRQKGGVYLGDIFYMLQQMHPSTVCFVFISTCANICDTEPTEAFRPLQPAAHTHFALDMSARGIPSSRPESYFGRRRETPLSNTVKNIITPLLRRGGN
jgi:hypothetical protein